MDLFGYYIVVKQWGEENQSSIVKRQAIESMDDALIIMEHAARQRLNDGYEMVPAKA